MVISTSKSSSSFRKHAILVLLSLGLIFTFCQIYMKFGHTDSVTSSLVSVGFTSPDITSTASPISMDTPSPDFTTDRNPDTAENNVPPGSIIAESRHDTEYVFDIRDSNGKVDDNEDPEEKVMIEYNKLLQEQNFEPAN
ncbi:unnamed protein product [Ambrosiozyma monospora]|uniref:Unnamed protein product n=1 Tax=Ambrosiozyma monospora TaxID=43982 RepID=A0A9W6Z1J6_AMBMO|nr:unnamed protein product [Ambrosiozyma monospora]